MWPAGNLQAVDYHRLHRDIHNIQPSPPSTPYMSIHQPSPPTVDPGITWSWIYRDVGTVRGQGRIQHHIPRKSRQPSGSASVATAQHITPIDHAHWPRPPVMPAHHAALLLLHVWPRPPAHIAHIAHIAHVHGAAWSRRPRGAGGAGGDHRYTVGPSNTIYGTCIWYEEGDHRYTRTWYMSKNKPGGGWGISLKLIDGGGGRLFETPE